MASSAGVSFDRMIALIAVGSETTRLSAETMGNAWKSMLSRFQQVKAGADVDEMGESINNVEKVLNKFNIQMRTTDGEFRIFQDVLDDVALSWENFSSVERAQIATAMAGTYQRNTFTAVMENYGKVLDYTTESQNSAGISAEKYGAYMDSMEAKLAQLTATWEKFVNNLNTEGAFDTIISTLESLINLLDTLLNDFGMSNLIIPTILGALAGKTISSAGNAIRSLSEDIGRLSSASSTAGGILKAMGQNAQVAVSGINLFSGAVGIAVGVIGLIVTAVDNYNRKQEELKQLALDSANAFQEEYNSASNLLDEYEELNEKLKDSNLTTAERRTLVEQLSTVQDGLVDLYGAEAEQLDLVNGKYEDQLEIIRKLSKEKLAQEMYDTQEEYEEAKSELETHRANMQGREQTLPAGEDISDLFEAYLKQNPDAQFAIGESSYGVGQQAIKIEADADLEQAQKDLKAFSTFVESEAQKTNRDVDAVLANLSGTINSIWSESMSENQRLVEARVQQTIFYNDELNKLWTDAESYVEEYNQVLADPEATNEQKQNAIDAIQTVRNEINSAIIDEENSDVMLEQFNSIFEEMDKASEFDFWLKTDEQAHEYLDTLQGLTGEQVEFNRETLTNEQERALAGLEEKANEAGISFESLIDILKEFGVLQLNSAERTQAFNETLANAPTYNETLSSFASEMENLSGRLSSLNDVVENFNQNGYITADMMQSITENDLLPYLSMSEGKLVANANALISDAEAAALDAKHKIALQAVSQIVAVAAEAEAEKTNDATIAMEDQKKFANALATQFVYLAKTGASVAETQVAITKSLVASGQVSESVADRIQSDVENIISSAYMQFDMIDSLALSTIDLGKASGSTSGSTDDLTDSLEKEKDALEDTKDAIQEEIDALKERQDVLDDERENLEDLIEMYIKMFKQRLEDEKDALEELKDAEDQRYEAVEDALDEEEEKRQEYFDNEKDRIEKLRDADSDYYDERIEALENELDAYQDKIDKQKELLQAKKEEQEYEEQLEEKVRDVAQIEAELAALQFDDSIEAQRKKLELAEELREKQEDLSDLQSDHEYDLQQDALDKELERFEELQKKKQEALEKEQEEMEDYWDERLDALEKEQEAWEKDLEERRKWEEDNHNTIIQNLDEQIKAIEKQIDDEKTLRLQAIEAIETKNQELYEALIEWNRTYGTGVDQDVIQKWEKAQDTLEKYDGVCDGVQETLEYIAKQNQEIVDKTAELEAKMKDVETQITAIDDKMQAIKDDADGINNSLSKTNNYLGGSGGIIDNTDKFAENAARAREELDYANIAIGDMYRGLKKIEDVSQGSHTWYNPADNTTISKYHTGTSYVQSSDEDRKISKAMGLKSDEVVRILKVGEAVIPKNENLNKLRSSENIISQSATYRTNEIIKNSQSYSNDNSSNLTISIGDTIIQGNADNSIISKLDEYKKSIVNEVFSRINKHTALSGFRNTKSYI